MKRIYLLCSLALLVCACAKDDKPASLTLDPASLTMRTREQITLKLLNAEGERIYDNIEWKCSDNQAVEILSDGLILVKQIGKAIITATYENETTICEITVEPNVFLAGFQESGANRTATYWKNGQAVSLANPSGSKGTQAMSIFVDQEDIYVAGMINTSHGTRGIYWKNGAAIPLSDGDLASVANSVWVDQGDVYVAGQEGNEAKYWKNGVLTVLDGKEANAILVANGNIYVAGTKYLRGVYWINGQQFELPADGITYINAIYVSGNDVYVAGRVDIDDKQPIAQYWKNGSPVALTNGERGAYLYSIWVDGSDVYAAGNERDARGVDHATYWKNGTPTVLDGTEAYGITVVGGQVFVAGWEAVSNEMTLAKYWRNDKAVAMPNTGYSFVGATSIFVK